MSVEVKSERMVSLLVEVERISLMAREVENYICFPSINTTASTC